MLGMNAMHALNRVSRFRRRCEVIKNMNAPDHQYAIFQLDLASYFSRQLFVACVYLARLQRTSEGAGESTTCSGNNVVECGRVWFSDFWSDTIVFSNGTVHAEAHRLWFGRQVG